MNSKQGNNGNELKSALQSLLGKKNQITFSAHSQRLVLEVDRNEIATILMKLKTDPGFDFQRLMHLTAYKSSGRRWWNAELFSGRWGAFLSVRYPLQEADRVNSISHIWPSAAAFEAQLEFLDKIVVAGRPERPISYWGAP